MKRWFIAAGSSLLLGCRPAPEPFPTGDHCRSTCSELSNADECLRQCYEAEIRFNNTDYEITAPGFWRFYDDFANRLPQQSRCGSGPQTFGGLVPLWRRALPVVLFDNTTEAPFGSRSPVSASHGRAAVSLGGIIWVLDATSGDVLHAWTQAWRPTGPPIQHFFEFAALSPGADMLWTWDVDGPVLIDLLNLDRQAGPRLGYAWHFDRPDTGPIAVDIGVNPSPAIGPDGTFYWQSQTGAVRAMSATRHLEVSVQRKRLPFDGAEYSPGDALELELNGASVAGATIAWGSKTTGAIGRVVVGNEGSSYWANGVSLEADGGMRWKAEPPTGVDASIGGTLEVERPGRRSYWPILWIGDSERTLAAHSLKDGAVLWSQRGVKLETAADWFSGSFSAQAPDGTLFIATRNYPDGDRGVVQARDGGTGDVMWNVELEAAEGVDGGRSTLRAGPIVDSSGAGVFVASENCKVYHVTPDGGVDAWYRLDAAPLFSVPQIDERVFYVVASTPIATDGGIAQTCAWTQPDARTRYGCYGAQCGPCVTGLLYYLYAFKTDAL